MMSKLIKSAIILHNWLEDSQEDVDLEDWMFIGANPPNDDLSLVEGEDAKYFRDLYKDYFTTLSL